MENTLVLKAVADETRMHIIKLLLRHNYCVRALARKLDISEAAVSQHLKILREAGLLVREKHGYFMHYHVNRAVLHELAEGIEALAKVERTACTPEHGGCHKGEYANCHNVKKDACSDQVKETCHGKGPYHHEGQCRYQGHNEE